MISLTHPSLNFSVSQFWELAMDKKGQTQICHTWIHLDSLTLLQIKNTLQKIKVRGTISM